VLDVARDDPLNLRRIISGANRARVEAREGVRCTRDPGVKGVPFVEVSIPNAAPA
jgi:hypothetical protein